LFLPGAGCPILSSAFAERVGTTKVHVKPKINAATDAGRFPILLLATILISLIVVSMNRLVWRRLYHLAETKYKLLG
jgi:ABC-type anion transport system duplicated permease subunit